MHLKEVFENADVCTWGSAVRLGQMAVASGNSRFSIVDGKRLSKPRNFFLLINLTNLTVVNQNEPLGVEFFADEGNSMI